MSLSLLSREALQLLELLPAWQLRGVSSAQVGAAAQTPPAQGAPVGQDVVALVSDCQGSEAMEPASLAFASPASQALPRTAARQGRGVALMIIIPRLGAATSPETRLWAQVVRALQGLGLPKALLDQPLQLDHTDQQLLAAELNARDPRWLLVFGDELARMVALVAPGLPTSAAPLMPATPDSAAPEPAAGPRILKTVSLKLLAGEPQKKAQAWQDFCWLKQQLLWSQ